MKKPGADACLNDGTTIRGSVNPCIFTRCDHRCDIHHLAPTNAVHGSRKASSVFSLEGNSDSNSDGLQPSSHGLQRTEESIGEH